MYAEMMGLLLDWEMGGLDEGDTLRLFAELVETGEVNHLNGHHQRVARDLGFLDDRYMPTGLHIAFLPDPVMGGEAGEGTDDLIAYVLEMRQRMALTYGNVRRCYKRMEALEVGIRHFLIVHKGNEELEADWQAKLDRILEAEHELEGVLRSGWEAYDHA